MRTLSLLIAVFAVAVVMSGCDSSPKRTTPVTAEEKAADAEKRRVRLGQNHQESTREQIIELARAIDTFRYDNNRYPVTLKELTSRPEDIGRDVWRGPYTSAGSKDSWGNEVSYVMPGSGDHAYDLTSWGEDGKQGGSGFGADLSNHD